MLHPTRRLRRRPAQVHELDRLLGRNLLAIFVLIAILVLLKSF